MRDQPHSEKELLRQIAKGSQDAYLVIFERYWDTVFSTSLLLTKSPELAEDIAQDVFAMIWEKREQLTTIEKLEPFLFITARNMIYSRLRKLSSQEAYRQYIMAYFSEAGAMGVDEQTELRELERAIQGAILRLPSQQQKAFRLSRFEGMRHEEIAATMGVSRITIKSYIVQALATLRKALANYPSSAVMAFAFFRIFF
ncbi:RNA polymerase sigma factor [Chitinophaga cymbidii]|uniref:DNA-directed RNA polymerase sigma-70 factor n=1 Tax=Chitinophaga cymbidii TaxID=1096750 RepID=A0A512RP91_9BACT|nr:RNA polymerase sigma-70 factor [Chitinophaga cymbidii]GEP97509.1 hypothetical protein CCY01nite_37690 [Chitinophaga cymbidii]